MSYLIDNKINLGSIVIPTGNNNDVTVFSTFYVQPPGFPNPLFSIADSGDITIGDPLNPTSITASVNIQYKFTEINGIDTNYNLTDTDYAVEIMSNTYNTITLPLSNGIGGRTYVISRGNTANNNLTLVAQPGDNIDGRATISLLHINDHIMVMSNDQLSWYVL